MVPHRRHSDDPLISGAIDDNHNEFEQITNCETLSTPSPSLTTNYKKPTRTRKKGQIKLRFHHQALPPEYLQHYEASQNQSECKDIIIESPTKDKNLFLSDCIDAEQRITDPVQMWLHKINEFQDDKIDIKSCSATSLTERNSNKKNYNEKLGNHQNVAVQSGSKIMNYNDLPYMGEMTLENSKPRRGRKPKKADICHLIYKNYGTVFPNHSTDERNMATTSTNDKSFNSFCKKDGESSIASVTKTVVPEHSKIISSLLEKHLTQKSQNVTNKRNNAVPNKMNRISKIQTEQPLNLCIRDKYGGNVLIEDSICCVDNDTLMEHETLTASTDFSSAPLFSPTLKMQLPNFQTAIFNNLVPSNDSTPDAYDAPSNQSWSQANMLSHPIAMYLQKMSDSSCTVPESYPCETTIEEIKSSTLDAQKPQRSVIVPKKTSQLMKEEILTTSTTPPNERNHSNETSTKPKRKRSAIFIPPVKEESSTNHATEVSICKFKFTGGAKPSLQEKKMLSVDAGGNFRYYSGTGDKSIRGYEFFPRESLQQSSLSACSSAGAFLNASGKKISGDLPPSSLYINSDLMQMQPNELKLQRERNAQIDGNGNGVSSDSGHLALNRRKRKSKRSMQRESLEKTFKEKGFLIQTQQLESAEGATYCKFRQLRKFTRYLFRSWKDYLPGELQQNQNPNQPLHPSVKCLDINEPSTSDYIPPTANKMQDGETNQTIQ